MWSVHRDESKWEDATVFRPERFLTADGKELVLPNHFIPYSIGKRSCPGESLAKMALFLIFASVLQRFSLSVDKPESVDMSPVNGITLDTHEYFLTAVPRT
ncbi:hypothetical protein RvY_08414 [Ramazzottius varieornatus]|uniref:Cytochrome P450 n=2 Tax=Ramazzottius varieornatus TaxID=947166 RepID=A0A1D1V8E3_RAMVA|nr:hypothetical protein RvY_08414 [Ramazzottius varieornatus]